ncbi:c-type cytochrome biogenesis protein CcmI [Gluconobacter cerevisiae]|uniref:C-type cytochrome biogenesis protein CcmI n=1 Tax=Gluconobacter cerevisiae TaxID=1379734 RepID=A0ABR9YB77_9PROT|nr:c-type cytochrome biogenesis protein CcmI [Gluconobacter cerevisiae]MBF0875901.1 c-type cytochrome biogenesis protein CcmI [Gluconobacter cerevisiae]
MFWLGILIIAAVALCPAFLGLRTLRRRVNARDSALTLYRGQLGDLERDHALALINGEEYQAARLEVQRRLLATDEEAAVEDLSAEPVKRSRVLPVLAVGLGIPVLAFALYIVNGHPSLPPQPLSQRQTGPDAKGLETIHKLQTEVATIPATSSTYATGHFMLGQVEASSGLTDDAIRDWKIALGAHFEPELAIRLAELESRNGSHISGESLDLYRRALAAAPADAPWRMAVEARIAVGEHQENNGQ